MNRRHADPRLTRPIQDTNTGVTSDRRRRMMEAWLGSENGRFTVYIVYQGNNAKALRAAEEIVRAAHDRGLAATAAPIDDVDSDGVVAASVLVAGCSAQVNTPFGGETTSRTRTWIDQVPDLDGKPCAVFCTYRFFPHTFADVTTRTAEVLDALARDLELKGGKVVASQAILTRKMTEGATALVDEIAEHI